MVDSKGLSDELQGKIINYHATCGKADGAKESTLSILLSELCTTILEQNEIINSMTGTIEKLKKQIPQVKESPSPEPPQPKESKSD